MRRVFGVFVDAVEELVDMAPVALLLFFLFFGAFSLILAVAEGTEREVTARLMENRFRIEPRGTREYPEDLSPAQVFELVNTTGQPVKLGRLTTSCGCIVLTSAKTEYAADERIELLLRNVRPSSGHTYGFFVHIKEPVTVMLEKEVYVISDGFRNKKKSDIFRNDLPKE